MNTKTITLVALALSLAGTALTQIPSVTKKDGHIAPNRAVVTYPDGHKKTVLILSFDIGNEYTALFQDTETEAQLPFFADTIREIKETTDRDVLIVFKNGEERRVKYFVRSFTVPNEQGTTEQIPYQKIKSVEFLSPPRKDKQGRAMFDHWVYSPYTGEKLPEVER